MEKQFLTKVSDKNKEYLIELVLLIICYKINR